MSNGPSGSRIAMIASIVALAVAIFGGVGSLMVNAFVIADPVAYGEVPLPGSADMEFPAGDVDISYRANTLTVGGKGVMVPPIELSIDPPAGVDRPLINDSMSSSTKSNREVTVRVFTVHVKQAGTYRVNAKASVFESQEPRLVFGHSSPYYWVVWPFVGLGVLAGGALAASIVWSMRSGKRTYPVAPQMSGDPVAWPPPAAGPGSGSGSPYQSGPPSAPYVPDEQAIRIEQLKTITALRDSGALTEAEFEAEKRRILDS
ncbi:SHOCT domain-containing protein [Mycobacterium sp. NS-7484]|uniref:SHOCT domain-containing protein n=1 Tax=Mycobacterium sp. NS-7484 TaxID=1834161 RepID=UPI0009F9AEF6|nr:SHOCT domain-containing protein [Mycobacterium sp. NS-7484]